MERFLACLQNAQKNEINCNFHTNLIGNRRSIAGSLIGGLPETQEMLNYCAKHNIVSDVEVIDIKDINTAYERMLKGDVRYRFVIDMATLNKS